MKELHIITPVKDSIESTLLTIEAIMASQLSIAHTYTVYNDFSTPENTARLEEAAERLAALGITRTAALDLGPVPGRLAGGGPRGPAVPTLRHPHRHAAGDHADGHGQQGQPGGETTGPETLQGKFQHVSLRFCCCDASAHADPAGRVPW